MYRLNRKMAFPHDSLWLQAIPILRSKVMKYSYSKRAGRSRVNTSPTVSVSELTKDSNGNVLIRPATVVSSDTHTATVELFDVLTSLLRCPPALQVLPQVHSNGIMHLE